MIDPIEPEIPEEDEIQASDTETVDAASAKGIRKQKRAIRVKDEQKRAIYRQLFSTPAGRRVMWEILNDTNPFEALFVTGPNGFPQPEATWFRAGQREYGLRLYQSWQLLDRDGVNLMLDENDPRFIQAKKSRKGG